MRQLEFHRVRLFAFITAIILSQAVIAAPPTAGDVLIPAGPYVPGQNITASYVFSDSDSNPELESRLTWYISPYSDGSDSTVLDFFFSEDTPYVLLIQESYRGRFIGFSVTPRDTEGEVGDTVYSTWELVNSLPVAYPDTFSALIDEGELLDVDAPGILENDTSGDEGQIITAHLVESPVNAASFSLNTNGAFNYTHDGSENYVDTFTYYASDGVENSIDTALVIIIVNPINDAPELHGIESQTLQYTEDDDPLIITSTLEISDIDNDTLHSATISILGGFVAGEDRLTYSSSTLTVSYDVPSGVMTLSGVFPISEYQTALRQIRYNNINTVNPNPSGRIIEFTVSDSSETSSPATRVIQITTVNDAPEANPDNYSEIPEGGSITTTVLANDHVISNDQDLDGPSALQATLVRDVEHGYLTFNSDGTFTYQHDSSEIFSDAFTYYVNDSEYNSDTVEVSLNMTAVNDMPELSNIETDTLIFIEDGTSRLISTSLVLSDEDDLFIDSATVFFSQGYTPGEDSLIYSELLGLTYNYNYLTGTLHITGNASLLNYQNTILRNIRYINTNTVNPSTHFRHISFVINDGDDDSDPITRVVTVEPVNDPPIASNAQITAANFFIGDLATITFDYLDVEGEAEGATTYRWFAAEDTNGTGLTQIIGWNTDTFSIRYSEGGAYLQAIVMPRDINGAVGTYDTTQYYYVNMAPALNNFSVINQENPGLFQIGEILRASYVYSDLEDSEGEHSFQWYSSSDGSWETAVSIPETVTDTFQIRAEDLANYIGLEVIPQALSGSSPGELQQSNLFLIGDAPSAILTGTDSICAGTTDSILVTLTGNNPPWTIRYTVNGLNETTISDISAGESQYWLYVTDSGTYELTHVNDAVFSSGTTTGQAVIAYYRQPTAQLVQDELAICDYDSSVYSIPVELSGRAPWQLSYSFSSAADTFTLTNIDTSYAELPATIANAGTCEIIHVWDAHCLANGSGTTQIMPKLNPRIDILGDTSYFCPGDSLAIQFSLTGNGPWYFYYTYNDGDEQWDTVPVSNNTTTHNIYVTEPGAYQVTRVFNENDEGCAYGNLEVEHFEIPTATISGSDTICFGGSIEFPIELTGTSPWELAYQRGTDPPIQLENIEQELVNIEATVNGTYRVVELSDANGCAGRSFGTSRLVVNPLPDVDVFLNQTVFTLDSPREPIYYSPPGGHFNASSSTAPIDTNDIGQWLFNPIHAYFDYVYNRPDPYFSIIYTANDQTTGCINMAEQVVTIIQSAATISFVDTAYQHRDMYCSSDDTIKIVGINAVGPNHFGSFSITGGVGLEDMGNNLAYIHPTMISAGQKIVTYQVDLGEGDIETAVKTMTFEVVNGDFIWDNECFNEVAVVNFYDTSTASQELADSKWNFYIADDTVSYEGFETSHSFNNRDTYWIEHIVSSQLNSDKCFDTIWKQLELKPTFNISSAPYSQNFNNGAAHWISLPEVADEHNSWRIGMPEGDLFNSPSNTQAWYTYISANSMGEDSYVVSPCFDLSTAVRPMIKFDTWRALTQVDGAVLQYTLNNGVDWFTLGAPDDGINWYNSYTVYVAPGGQTLGWTDITDNNWVEVRHKLDELKGQSNIRFRIAYAATNGLQVERDGLSFDNIWIGERRKKVLLEYFTNTTDATYVASNESFNTLVNKTTHADDIIDIQFYLDSSDPFNQQNPFVHNARNLYYGGVPELPFGIIDGGRGNQSPYLINFAGGEVLSDNDLKLAALDDNILDIDMETIKGGNTIIIEVTLTALQDIPLSDLTLHVAIIENVVNITGENGQHQFESVVADMLPDAIGTPVNISLDAGNSAIYEYSYDYSNIRDDSQIRIVAFVQDELDREVLQAAKINPGIATNINDENLQTGFSIYPNPTSDYAFLLFNQSFSEQSIVEVMSLEGQLLWNSVIHPGRNAIQIDLTGFNPGVYMVRIIDDGKVVGSSKLVRINTR